MRTGPMGSTGLTVPVQGFGCMRLDANRMPGGSAAALAVIHRALELGATLLDTADMYGDGRNETLVGEALRGHRDEAVLCTKFGVVRAPDGALMTRGDAAYVRSACDASLTRLGTDVIDLYYLHDRDHSVPIEETVAAMADLVTAGKIRHLGLSNVTGDEVRAAYAVHPIAAVQPEWSLVSRSVEAMLPTCVELGVGIVPYCPQGAGGLNLNLVRIEGRRPPRAGAVPDALRGVLADVARRRAVRPGQVALAWVQQRADIWKVPVTPIPGTTRLAHLEENVAAAGLALAVEDLARLDAASLPLTGAPTSSRTA